MKRRAFLASAAAPFAFAARRPNILLITADDLGLIVGCYGEKRIATPNLDSLAASGVRFTTAYVVQASCSPSRSGMFTGLFGCGYFTTTQKCRRISRVEGLVGFKPGPKWGDMKISPGFGSVAAGEPL
ncbi:MAG: sulfatase-like hydrolase/transferase, partial [Acidobacteria bacterium]|nr:sulfatase-like hydrolase/transferase [Acidobacteriota bacterium]